MKSSECCWEDIDDFTEQAVTVEGFAYWFQRAVTPDLILSTMANPILGTKRKKKIFVSNEYPEICSSDPSSYENIKVYQNHKVTLSYLNLLLSMVCIKTRLKYKK